MPALFVSHNSRDNDAVAHLRDWLVRQGYDSLFLDFDPEHGLPAGAKWEAELYSQLRRADAVLFVGSQASVSSQWCFAELAMARSLGKPIVPVMLAEDGVHPLLADTQSVDLRGGGERAFERLRRSLRAADLDPERSFEWRPGRSPFPGLEVFEERDAGVFFGREPEIERLLELLRSSRRKHTGRLLTLVGPSGSGKSSLVRAGLIPRLRGARQPWLVLPPLRPGDQPVRQLALVLADAFRATPEPRSINAIERALGAGGLVELAEELCHLSPRDSQPAVLVFVDQAEELVTLTGSRERERFLALLHGATRREGPLWSVLTLRSEFLSAFLQTEGGAQLFDEQLLVGPLDRSRLAEVIERPAARAGMDFAPGLVGRMVQDTGGGDALPLLAYTLAELYEHARRRTQQTITAADYDGLGGVVGALRRSADREQQQLSDRGLGEVVIPALGRLVAIGPEGQPTRRRLPRHALSEQDTEVVDAFVEARLLTSSQIEGEPVVEVAHEALLRQWPPLSEAIEVHHQELYLRSELERGAHAWERNERGLDYLLRGERLQAAERLTASQHMGLGEFNQLERDFLTASVERKHQEQAASQQRTRRVFAGLLTALLVVSALAVVALLQANRATDQAERTADQRDTARATLLASNALSELPADPGQSLVLARRAFATKATNLSEGVLRLATSQATPQRVLRGHRGLLFDVAFAADGRHVASASNDGSVRVWDSRAARTPPTILRHGDPVYGVAFAADGRHLASAGSDGTVRVWDWRAARTPPTILRHGGQVWGVAFAAGGRYLASAGGNGTVRVWDWRAARTPPTILRGRGYYSDTHLSGVAFAADGRHLASAGTDGRVHVWDWRAARTPPTILRHASAVEEVAFAADGRHLASAGEDGTVRVWDWRAARTPPTILRGHRDQVSGVAFAVGGRYLASAGEDGTVRVWDWRAARTPPTILRGHRDPVTGVAFAADGRLASAGEDGTVRVWDWRAARTPPTILRHAGAVVEVAFAADGRHLASAGDDGTVRVWDWRAARTLPTILRGHRGPVFGVAFAAGGRYLASAGSDGTVRVWDWRAARRPPTILRGPGFYDVAFAPDGRHLAGASGEGTTVRVWDWRAARTPPTILRHRDWVSGVAFAADGRHLASGGDDGTVRVWDWRAARTPPTILRGHGRPVYGVAFAADGRHLASASSDGTVRVWDWRAARTPPTILRGPGFFGVAFAADGRHLASAGHDGTVRVWDWRVARTPPTILRGGFSGVAFAPDGRHLASSGHHGTVRVWECQRCGDIDHVLELARTRVPHEITSP